MRIARRYLNAYFYTNICLMKIRLLFGLILSFVVFTNLSAQTVHTVKLNNKFGLIDSLGKIILAPVYDYVTKPVDGAVAAGIFATKQHILASFDRKNMRTIPYIANNVIEIGGKNLFILTDAGKKGLMNSKGEILIQPDIYSNFTAIPGSPFIKAVTNTFEDVVKNDGTFLLPPKTYQYVRVYLGGLLILAEHKTAKHVYDGNGKLIELPFAFDFSKPLQQLIDSLDKYRLLPPVNTNTSVLKRLSPNDLNSYQQKSFPFLEKPKQISFPFLTYYRCDNEWELVRNDWGDKRFDVKKGDFVFYKPDGSLAILEKFDDAKPFYRGFAPVKKGKLWGFIDTTGKWIIQPQYENAWQFSEGLALVRMNEKNAISNRYAFIDSTGKMIIPPMFDGSDNYYFSNGIFKGYQGNDIPNRLTVTINKKGEIIALYKGNTITNTNTAIHYFNTALLLTKNPNPNYPQIQENYEKAALHGYTSAMTNLGSMYKNRRIVKPDGSPDYDKAMYWLTRSGNDELALSNIGHMYEIGQGTKRDMRKALQYYTLSALKPTEYSTYSMEKLAQFYGRGVDDIIKDTTTANYWVETLFKYDSVKALSAINYIKTGKTAYQDAMASMADAFSNINDAFKDMTDAMGKFNDTLIAGNAELQARLLNDARREITNKKYSTAFTLLKQLEPASNAAALYLLGELYESGQGTTKDMKRAKELYQKAADKNYTPALEAIKRINKLPQ
jgi:TPR repeat protein